MAESGLARPTAATRAAFGIPSSIVGGMVARALARVAARGLALSTARESTEKYVFGKSNSNTHFTLVLRPQQDKHTHRLAPARLVYPRPRAREA
jgi:hypothetical protein